MNAEISDNDNTVTTANMDENKDKDKKVIPFPKKKETDRLKNKSAVAALYEVCVRRGYAEPEFEQIFSAPNMVAVSVLIGGSTYGSGACVDFFSACEFAAISTLYAWLPEFSPSYICIKGIKDIINGVIHTEKKKAMGEHDDFEPKLTGDSNATIVELSGQTFKGEGNGPSKMLAKRDASFNALKMVYPNCKTIEDIQAAMEFQRLERRRYKRMKSLPMMEAVTPALQFSYPCMHEGKKIVGQPLLAPVDFGDTPVSWTDTQMVKQNKRKLLLQSGGSEMLSNKKGWKRSTDANSNSDNNTDANAIMPALTVDADGDGDGDGDAMSNGDDDNQHISSSAPALVHSSNTTTTTTTTTNNNTKHAIISSYSGGDGNRTHPMTAAMEAALSATVRSTSSRYPSHITIRRGRRTDVDALISLLSSSSSSTNCVEGLSPPVTSSTASTDAIADIHMAKATKSTLLKDGWGPHSCVWTFVAESQQTHTEKETETEAMDVSGGGGEGNSGGSDGSDATPSSSSSATTTTTVVVGAVFFSLGFQPPSGRCLTLETIVIREDHRRLGLASAFLSLGAMTGISLGVESARWCGSIGEIQRAMASRCSIDLRTVGIDTDTDTDKRPSLSTSPTLMLLDRDAMLRMVAGKVAGSNVTRLDEMEDKGEGHVDSMDATTGRELKSRNNRKEKNWNTAFEFAKQTEATGAKDFEDFFLKEAELKVAETVEKETDGAVAVGSGFVQPKGLADFYKERTASG
eukprot:gene6287-12731_t